MRLTYVLRYREADIRLIARQKNGKTEQSRKQTPPAKKRTAKQEVQTETQRGANGKVEKREEQKKIVEGTKRDTSYVMGVREKTARKAGTGAYRHPNRHPKMPGLDHARC